MCAIPYFETSYLTASFKKPVFPNGSPRLPYLVKSFLFILIFSLSLQEGKAQTRTIINTEKSTPDPETGFHSSLKIDGSASTGNIELININGNGMLGYRRPQDWLRILGGSTYFKQDGVKYLDNHYGQLRYSRFFGPEKRWQSYSFAQFQSNFTLILKERGIVGSGIRRSFPLKDSGRFDLGGGIMWEYERLDQARLEEDEAVIHRNWRFTSVIVFRRALGDNVSVLNTAYFQPKVSDPSDIRALLTQLTEHFQFDVTFYWRTDTRPPQAIVPSDLGVDLGVLVEV
ncbi:MAG: DUF481 domain-containing protein [Flavobacteriales bacterium]